MRNNYYLCTRNNEQNDSDMATDKVAHWLDIADYNIDARYPEDREALSRTLTDEFCRRMIDETKQLQQWIKDKL